MSPLINSVYFSVLTYNPNVLTRPYCHLTTKASIELHHILCISLDILIVRFGDEQVRAEYEPSETYLLPFNNISWLFDELSDNNA